MSAPPESAEPVGPVRLAAALAAVFVSGCLVALQSRLTGELGQRLGDGFLAALLSFGSGLLLLLIGTAIWRPGRRGIGRVVAAVRGGRIPWWFTLGGAGGALFVLGQGLTVGLLGVALFTVATVCGQTVTSLLIDRRGIGTMHRRAATPGRIVGSALAVVAVGIAVSGQIRPDAPLLALLLPLLAGVAVGWQQAVNGQIRAVSGSVFTATLGNFAVGTTLLAIATLVHLGIAGWHVEFPPDPWLYLGGVLGITFIALQAFIVRLTGVLLLGLALLAGQLTASVVFDLIVPLSRVDLAPATIIGTVLTFAAVLIAAIPSRRSRGVRATSGVPSR